VDLYIYCPILVHGGMLNSLRTGATLAVPLLETLGQTLAATYFIDTVVLALSYLQTGTSILWKQCYRQSLNVDG
jgi:hypothetical protein